MRTWYGASRQDITIIGESSSILSTPPYCIRYRYDHLTIRQLIHLRLDSFSIWGLHRKTTVCRSQSLKTVRPQAIVKIIITNPVFVFQPPLGTCTADLLLIKLPITMCTGTFPSSCFVQCFVVHTLGRCSYYILPNTVADSTSVPLPPLKRSIQFPDAKSQTCKGKQYRSL